MKTSNDHTLPAWHQVEKKISDEMQWLESTIDTFREHPVDTAGKPVCKRCVLRTIATLLVYGDVKAQQITKGSQLQDFWLETDVNNIDRTAITHGKEWHRDKMTSIEQHFQKLNFKVEREPYLNFGRADLGVYEPDTDPLYIEVGTTSFFKLATNLKAMKNFTYLIVPNDEILVEFKKQ